MKNIFCVFKATDGSIGRAAFHPSQRVCVRIPGICSSADCMWTQQTNSLKIFPFNKTVFNNILKHVSSLQYYIEMPIQIRLCSICIIPPSTPFSWSTIKGLYSFVYWKKISNIQACVTLEFYTIEASIKFYTVLRHSSKLKISLEISSN